MNGPGKESMKRKYKIAMVQMDTQNNKEKNLEDACAWIDEAAASGAELVCFPEVMNLIGKNTGPGGGREPVPGFSTERLMERRQSMGSISMAAALRRRSREKNGPEIPACS